MKKKILSVLCAATMLLSAAGMTAFAEGEYKKFAEADFDTTINLGTLTSDSDKIVAENGNKYLTASGFYSLDYARKNVIIDLKAQYDGSGYNFGEIQTRDGGTGNTWERTTSVRFVNTGWYYFRIVYDFENSEIKTYRSQNGWGDLQEFGMTTSFGKDSTGAYASGMQMIKFVRLNVDDIMIYQNGTMPTAAVSVINNGKRFSAAYDYYDAEGDAQAGVKYQWQVSDDGITFTDIADATEQTYEAASAYSGKYIRCGVTPISSRYPSEGVQAYSNAVEYKEYTTYISQDFEGTDFTPFASGDTISDEVNTSKYLKLTGNQVDVSGLSAPTDETVVELRAKTRATTANGGKSWFIVTFIGDKYWDNQTQYAVDGGADDWKYYRFVFEGKENPTFKAYTSSDRTEWKEAGREVGYTSTTYNNARGKMDKIYQLRFGSCYIDDVRVYRYGTAPTGSDATVARDGDMLSAAFVFADAENDSMGAAKYQWQRSADGVSYEDIDGAVGSEYELCNADFEKYVRVQITPTSCAYPTYGENIASQGVRIDSFVKSKIGEIGYIIDGVTLTASADVIRSTAGDTAIFIAAAYDGTALTKVLLPKTVTDISGTARVSEEFDISGIDAAAQLKLMLWNDMQTLVPLVDSVPVER